MTNFFYTKLVIVAILTIFYARLYSATDNEKYFVVVIPSYNNQRWYERNLASVLNQNYEQFHVLYTDDCSCDNTAELVEKYLELYDTEKKVTLIKNSTRHGALYNLYHMITMSDDEAIIVTLDGDDWFPDNEVLARLNTIYSAEDIWLTYGQFKLHPSGNIGWASSMPDYIIENNAFRDFQHLPTHLRTFYSWLFKEIKLEDLLYVGQFYPMTWDMVMMFPMIEMAGERHRFISDVMYVYNEENDISDHYVSRQLQAHLAQVVKKKPRYKRLLEKPIKKSLSIQSEADVIIFSQTPQQLEQLLISLKRYVEGIGHIFVMYQPISVDEIDHYAAIIEMYPEATFYHIGEYKTNFNETLSTIYHQSDKDYILFSKGDSSFYKPLSLSECITNLKKTSAYAFYFNLNAQDGIKQYPCMIQEKCMNEIIVWNFSLARDKWSLANSLDMVLHKKSNSFALALQNYYDLTPNGLERTWSNEGNLDRLGLCFQETKITSIYKEKK